MGRCLLLALLISACSDPAVSSADGDLGPRSDRWLTDRSPAVDRVPLDRGRPDGAFSLGNGCASDLDCSASLTCELGWPGGSCTRTCSVDTDCAPAGHPPTSGCFEERCRPRCDPRAAFSPCRAGYVCRIDGARALCVPDCRIAKGCAAGWSCEKGSGLCIDPTSGAVGAACGAPPLGRCDGTPNGVCYALGGFGGGFCTIPCSPFTRPCPLEIQGSVCLLGSIAAPYCGFTCDPKAPSCPHPGMSCTPVGEVHVCLP